MPKDKIPDGYVKKTFEYDGKKIDGYVLNNSDFYLIYAQNETTDVVNGYKKKADNYFLYLLISIGVLAITIITFSIILIKKKDNRHKIKNKNKLM